MKIRCVHLTSQPDSIREQRSVAEVGQLAKHGIEVVSVVNPPYTGDLPDPRPGFRPFTLTPGAYGCWKAHRDALDHLSGVDGLLVCECDCLFVHPIEKTVKLIHRSLEACNQGNLAAFTLGYKHGGKTMDTVGDDVIVISQWIETHCYMVPIRSLDIFKSMYEKPWDQIDYCMTIYLYDQQKHRIGAFASGPAAIQADGVSLTDGSIRKSENHYRHAKH